MIPQRQKELQDRKLQAPTNIIKTRLTNDIQLFERLMKKPPANPKASGDMRYPGYSGVWGEWIASQGSWTDNRWFVSAIRGFPKTNRMSFAKAWMIKCMRQGKLK